MAANVNVGTILRYLTTCSAYFMYKHTRTHTNEFWKCVTLSINNHACFAVRSTPQIFNGVTDCDVLKISKTKMPITLFDCVPFYPSSICLQIKLPQILVDIQHYRWLLETDSAPETFEEYVFLDMSVSWKSKTKNKSKFLHFKILIWDL